MQAGVQSAGRPGVGQAAAEIDLGALGRALWRKKFLIVGLTLLTAALAFGAVSLITPRYKSEARVLIETRENIFLRPDAEKSLERSATVDQEAVTSQVQLILSRDLAREIIKKLKLAERPEFDPVLRRPGTLQTVLRLTGIAKDPRQMTPEERVLKSYYERLAAFQVEKSRVIAIEFESEDPELAAQAANAIAEGYLVLQQATKQDQTRSAGAWLAGEIERLRGKVAEAEGKVEQYRSKTNLFIGNNNTMLSNQQLGDFNAQLASARAQKADAEGKANMIREALRTGAAVEFSDIINSELMRRLSEQRVTLRAQLAEQSSTLLDQHPRIKELRAQISDLERQMRSEADRLARSLENDAKLASTKVDSLSVGLEQLKRQAAARARCQVAARPARILPCQVSRGDRARQHRRRLAGRPHHLDRGGLHHAGMAEEAADRAGGGARHVRAVGGLRADQRIAGRAAGAGGGRAVVGRACRAAGGRRGGGKQARHRASGARLGPARGPAGGERAGGRARGGGRAARSDRGAGA